MCMMRDDINFSIFPASIDQSFMMEHIMKQVDVLKNEQDMAYLVILWFYWNIGHLVCYLDM